MCNRRHAAILWHHTPSSCTCCSVQSNLAPCLVWSSTLLIWLSSVSIMSSGSTGGAIPLASCGYLTMLYHIQRLCTAEGSAQCQFWNGSLTIYPEQTREPCKELPPGMELWKSEDTYDMLLCGLLNISVSSVQFYVLNCRTNNTLWRVWPSLMKWYNTGLEELQKAMTLAVMTASLQVTVALPSLCHGQHHLTSIYLQNLLLDTATHWPLLADSQVQSQASNCGICGGQSCSGTGFCLSTIFLSPSCTDASYSFIYLSLTLYNLGNWPCDDPSHPGNSFWDDSPFILDKWLPKNGPVLQVTVKASNSVQYFWCY